MAVTPRYQRSTWENCIQSYEGAASTAKSYPISCPAEHAFALLYAAHAIFVDQDIKRCVFRWAFAPRPRVRTTLISSYTSAYLVATATAYTAHILSTCANFRILPLLGHRHVSKSMQDIISGDAATAGVTTLINMHTCA